MPKASEFIKGSDALHATRSLLLLLKSEETKLNKKERNKSKWQNKSIIYVQNRTK